MRLHQHAHGQLVVDLVDVDAAALHLAVDAVDVLRAAPTDRPGCRASSSSPRSTSMTRWMYFSRCDAPAGDLVGDLVVLLGLEVAERQVLELPLQLPDAQPVGQRRVDLHRLLRDAAALGRRPELERPHVVQPVGQLDQHHADVLGHGQEHLAHVLGPQVLAVQRRAGRRRRSTCRNCILSSLVTPSTSRATSRPKRLSSSRHRHAAVFGDVVAQRGDDRRGVHVQAGQRLGHRQRVVDVRLARLAELRRVRLGGEHVGALDRLDVWRRADTCRRRRKAPAGCAQQAQTRSAVTRVVSESTTADADVRVPDHAVSRAGAASSSAMTFALATRSSTATYSSG